MLKIKDNVDLKELEKYGFLKNSFGDYEYDCCDNTSYVLVFTSNCKETNTFKRDIALITGFYGDSPELCFDGYQLDILFDLIKANIVEIR